MALPLGLRRFSGTAIFAAPLRYWPVRDSAVASICCGLALRDEVAAGVAGAGAEVHDEIGAADGVFVVLDDEDGVAKIA